MAAVGAEVAQPEGETEDAELSQGAEPPRCLCVPAFSDCSLDVRRGESHALQRRHGVRWALWPSTAEAAFPRPRALLFASQHAVRAVRGLLSAGGRARETIPRGCGSQGCDLAALDATTALIVFVAGGCGCICKGQHGSAAQRPGAQLHRPLIKLFFLPCPRSCHHAALWRRAPPPGDPRPSGRRSGRCRTRASRRRRLSGEPARAGRWRRSWGSTCGRNTPRAPSRAPSRALSPRDWALPRAAPSRAGLHRRHVPFLL